MRSKANEIEKLKNRITEINERGQNLRKRELKIADKVKYLLSSLQDNKFQTYNAKLIEILIKYQQLQVMQQNVLEKSIVSPQQMDEFQKSQLQLQQTIIEIGQFENQLKQIKSELESSFVAKELQNGHFLFSLKAPSETE